MQATRVQCGGQSRCLPADSGAQQSVMCSSTQLVHGKSYNTCYVFPWFDTTGDAFFRLQYRPRFLPPCRHSQTTSDRPPARQWCAERILRSRHSTNDVPERIPKSVVIRTSHNITARSAQLSVWWRQPCNCQESGLPESFWMSPGNRMIS